MGSAPSLPLPSLPPSPLPPLPRIADAAVYLLTVYYALLRAQVIRRYALNRLWISGFLLDMCGAALMLTALSQAPVSVVQPVAGCGLAILCVFSHFYLKEVMNGLDWIAITLAGVGTIGVGVGGEEQKVEEIPLVSIPWLVLCILILFVGSAQHLASYVQETKA
ncbi:probable magnesium transporter NIPA9 [Lolium perenne]|uniref:probable magnesium transporter NIPA9 n=1 Tax=Lolium perenne TaxID=4522 RepID=UPI0021F68F27|nr:probable magnesium transporter NIPA9 [Lolium perenne]